MKWDAVEREMVILGTQLERVSSTFLVLANELRKEREVGTVGLYEGRESTEVGAKSKTDGAAEPPSPS